MKYLTEHVKRASYNHNNSITRVYIQGDGGPVRAEHGAHGAALRAKGHRALPAAALQLQRPGGHPGRWRGARETQQTSGDRMFFINIVIMFSKMSCKVFMIGSKMS